MIIDGYSVGYDDVDHRYDIDNDEVISVTQTCRDGCLSDEQAALHYTEESRERGQDIHDGLLYHFRYSIEPDLKPSVQPYWNQAMAFLTSTEFEVESAEEIIMDPLLRYAGRYDFLGRLKRFMTHEDPSVDLVRDMVDVKTGSVPMTVGAQTMGYRRRLRPNPPLVRRWALHLTPTNYRLLPLNTHPISGRYLRELDRRDEHLFLAALTIAKFRKEHYGR